jgi:hypothetical protein
MSTENNNTWRRPSELPDLRRVGVIALDTETRDLGLAADRGSAWPWNGGYVCGASIAYREGNTIRPLYFPLRHPDTDNFDREQFFRSSRNPRWSFPRQQRTMQMQDITIWVTRDGQRIPVREMNSHHLVNAIAAIEREWPWRAEYLNQLKLELISRYSSRSRW